MSRRYIDDYGCLALVSKHRGGGRDGMGMSSDWGRTENSENRLGRSGNSHIRAISLSWSALRSRPALRGEDHRYHLSHWLASSCEERLLGSWSCLSVTSPLFKHAQILMQCLYCLLSSRRLTCSDAGSWNEVRGANLGGHPIFTSVTKAVAFRWG